MTEAEDREYEKLRNLVIACVPAFGPDPRQEGYISDTESDGSLITNLETDCWHAAKHPSISP